MKARLDVVAAIKNGRTTLLKSFATPPFKLAQLPALPGGSLPLMLMSSSPGVLDGDAYEIKINVGEGAAVELKTQSYQRLFPMQKGASQTAEIHVAANAMFSFLPHPVVPHRHSHFQTFSNIHMHPTATLLWGEVLTPGRQLQGETFAFTEYRNCTQIFMQQKLAVKENVWWQPGTQPWQALGLMEGFTHSASLLFIAPHGNMAAQKERLLPQLQALPSVAAGVSLLPVNGLCVRLLGHSAERLFAAVQHVAAQLWQIPAAQKNVSYAG